MKSSFKIVKLNIKVKPILVTIAVIFVTIVSCNKRNNLPTSVDSHFPEFEKKWSLYQKSAFGGWKNNLQGRFSWDDSYAMEGLVLNYLRSNDKRYLDTFIKISNRVLNAADINLGFKDKYRSNRVLNGWSTTRYTSDSDYHIFGVTDAMILYPIIKFYNIIHSKIDINQSDRKFFDDALVFAKKEFSEVQIKDWVEYSNKGGYFQDPYYTSVGILTPVNQYSRVGTYAIELYKATGDLLYIEYAKKIASFIKSNLIYKEDYFYWNYIINNGISNTPEDLGHSILVIQFMISCFQNNIVFNEVDIKQLINLFNKQISVSNSVQFREYLNGNVISSDPYVSHYYLLSEYDRSVYEFLNTWQIQQNFILDSNSFLNHFGNKIILLDAMNNYYK